tara:strand:+ start:61 stop:456 length:396 start_codon:yes stop_codon:yes gene_type:complete
MSKLININNINYISNINYNNTYHANINNNSIFLYPGIILLIFCCILSYRPVKNCFFYSKIIINNIAENLVENLLGDTVEDNNNTIQDVSENNNQSQENQENQEKNSTNIVIYDSDDSENLPTYNETIKDEY